MSAVTVDRKRGTLQVNVVNMIDILIILLVFLLTNFATSTFEDTTSLPARMPVFTGDPPPQRPQATQLEVRMTREDGFKIVVRTEDESAGVIDVALKDDGAFDYERLSDELLKIKQAYAARQDVLLEADKRLPFDQVVKAMDAVREKIVTGGGNAIRLPLFPAVALTDLP